MKWDSKNYRLSDAGRIGSIALIIGIIGLAATIAGYAADSKQFFFSYLDALVFWFTLAIGALFLIMMHYLIGTTWVIVVRRIAEQIMFLLPVLAILFIPIFFGLHDLYHWSHSETVAQDHVLQGKSPYLNVPFFVARYVVFFGIWSFLAWVLRKGSFEEDASGFTPALKKKMMRASAPGMVAFALTLSFASFDWMMSLDAHWYSTIFGVYIFSGSVVGVLSAMILLLLWLRRRGVLAETVTIDRYHDLGKLLFAFMVFWGYMAFSQYFLIWYANIPEETEWFLKRWAGSWKTVTLLIVLGNFAVPFFILITRGAKRKLGMLGALAIWLFIMHWIDIHWVIMPNLHHEGFHLSWMDISATIGIGGIFVWFFWNRFVAKPLVPINDPKLNASINMASD